eukprot:CAMPEP_0184691662 /NCGR_PEP_ID=MMETSP0313-20130426/441_1 /TAXON_ID=2792 /ORGANISM="Porphyridium aerugineum, Strain SAG 1380-2" /LENGTH=544 /DNA_ID=CAMNT_0027149417 /DNA_START=248 /DNA_END=1882 /DNA_ORIENTATION=-
MAEVNSWSVDDVCDFLKKLEFSENVVKSFKDNAIGGKDLLALTEDEMKNDLSLSNLQVKKLKRELEAAQSNTQGVAAGSAPAGPSWGSTEHAAVASAPAVPLVPYAAPPVAYPMSATAAPAPAPVPVPTAYPIPGAVPVGYPIPGAASAPYSHLAPAAVMAPAAASPIAVAPLVTGKKSEISLEDAKNYWKLKQDISRLEAANLASKIKDTDAKIKNTGEAIKKEKETLAKVKKAFEKAEEEKTKREEGGWYLGKNLRNNVLVGNSTDEKLKDEAEKKFDEAEEKVKNQEAKLNGLNAEYKKLNSEHDKMVEEFNTLKRYKNDLDILMNRLFLGERAAGNDDKSNTIQREIDAMRPAFEENKRKKQTYTEAETELSHGAKAIDAAERMLQDASRRADMDMRMAPGPTNGPRGRRNDMDKRQDVDQAEHLYNAALMHISRAKQAVPEIPPITAATIQQAGKFGDVRFDNMVGDAMARKKIQGSLASVTQAMVSVNQALAWLKQKIHTDIDPEYYRLTGMIESKEKELNVYRHVLMDQAVTAHKLK